MAKRHKSVFRKGSLRSSAVIHETSDCPCESLPMPRMKLLRRRVYDTDLSDCQWALIEPMIPLAAPGGRLRKAATRDLDDDARQALAVTRSGFLKHALRSYETGLTEQY